jgi:hypothetical protein
VSAAAIASSVRAAFTLAFPPTQQHDIVLVDESGIKRSVISVCVPPDVHWMQAAVSPH